jgi:hypothetical protein
MIQALMVALVCLIATLSASAGESVLSSLQAAQSAYGSGDYDLAAGEIQNALYQMRLEFTRKALPEQLPGFTGQAAEVGQMKVPGFVEGNPSLPIKGSRNYQRNDGEGTVQLELTVGRPPQRDNPFLRFLQQNQMQRMQAEGGPKEFAFAGGKATIKPLADGNGFQIDADAGKMASVKLTCTGCKDEAEAQGLLQGLDTTLLSKSF